jgi:hypothetical protein
MIGLCFDSSCSLDVVPLNRFKESLRETARGRTLFLEYDVTLLPSTRVLDNMESIERIECNDDAVQIFWSSGTNVEDLKERFELHSVLVAGKEWGCSYDRYGNPEPLHRRILDKYVQKEQIFLKTKKCSPLEAYSKHSIEMWSEQTDPDQFEMRRHKKSQKINENATHEASRLQNSSRRISTDFPAFEFGPTDESSLTMQNTISVLKSGNSEISLAWDILSRFTFYFKIEGFVDFDITPTLCDGWLLGRKCHKCQPCFPQVLVISYCKVSVRVRQTATLSLLSKVQAPVSKILDMPLAPKVPIPYAGIGFKAGGVELGVGFFIELIGRGSFAADGLFEMSAAITVSTDLTTGFEYNKNSGFQPIGTSSPITPTKSFSWGGKVTALLRIGVLPILSLELMFLLPKLGPAGLGLGISFKVRF